LRTGRGRNERKVNAKDAKGVKVDGSVASHTELVTNSEVSVNGKASVVGGSEVVGHAKYGKSKNSSGTEKGDTYWRKRDRLSRGPFAFSRHRASDFTLFWGVRGS